MDVPRIDPSQAEVFYPQRSPRAYLLLLTTSGALLSIVCYALTHPMLESQIALGLDPGEVVKFISLALAGEMIVVTLTLMRLKPLFLGEGELRLFGSTLILCRGGSVVVRDASEVRRLTCGAAGANLGIRFSNGAMYLPGQWLPPGWVPTRKGWRTPGGGTIRASREANPLLATLFRRRPDLKPRVAGRIAGFILVEVLFVLFGALFLAVAEYPLMSESRKALDRHRRDERLLEAFQAGSYSEACPAYRKALPELRHDLYGSQDASHALRYCGDRKGALTAALGYLTTPFWPVAMDPEVVAAARIASGEYAEAARLLRPGGPSYLLYVALADLGQRAEAERVLETVPTKGGFVDSLLLRHRGRTEEALTRLEAACSRFRAMTKGPPIVLARSIEACLLAEGPEKVAGDQRFSKALRELPGLREEVGRFADRELVESSLEVHRDAGTAWRAGPGRGDKRPIRYIM